jgi:glycosyltransferase involved in cell wall biosynthesis
VSTQQTDPARLAAPQNQPEPVRVIRILGSLDVGGAEHRCLELMPRLVAAGVIPHFVTVSGRRGSLAREVERLGGSVHPLPIDLRFPLRFLRLLRRIRPRVVHSDIATFSGFPLLLAALAGVPVRIAHFHSDGDGQKDTLRRRGQRAAMRKLIAVAATDIVGVTPGALTYGYQPTWTSDPRCRVVANGLDLGRLRRPSDVNLRAIVGAATGDLVCLCIGRPDPIKRRPMVPAIVAALQTRGVAARAVLVGPRDPDDDAKVLGSARAHGVADRVHLLGSRDDVGALLQQADVLIHPAHREGLPGVVLEAVGVGTPVVASDLPGVRFIDEHLIGLAPVDPAAPPEAWAEAVQSLGLRPGQPHDTEDAFRRFDSSVFSLEAATNRYLTLYRARSDGGRR